MPPGSYFDECVSHVIVKPLRAHGMVLTTAQAEGMQGAADEAHLSLANRRGQPG